MSNKIIKKFDKKNICILIGSIVLFIVTFCGYGTEISKITDCVTTVKKYVTAEYSDIECGIDFEGNSYCDTDYWSESASDVFEIVTVNGNMGYKAGYFKPLFSSGYYSPPMPSPDKSMSTGSDFNNFLDHSDSKLEVQTNKTRFTEPAYKTESCLNKLGGRIFVKTWYGISYGSDFNVKKDGEV